MSDDPSSTTIGEGSPDPNPATEPQDAKPTGPSLARRLITWFFILILLGFTAFEWYTKKCYSDSLTAMENRYDEWREQNSNSTAEAKAEPMTLAASQSLIRGIFRRNQLEMKNNGLVEFQWKSLTKTYAFYVMTAKESDIIVNIVTDNPL